ncbi:MAG: response regulator [Deltaproteobacteria bacterium]|nr:response regulator [Deltaproteobacteria bacterium]
MNRSTESGIEAAIAAQRDSYPDTGAVDVHTQFSVLLVDDSPVALRGMARVLRKHWEIDVAACSDEALYLIRRNGYSVVITDCDMPGRNGLWLLEQTRRHSPNTIRILTSAGEQERFAPYMKSGLIQCFLNKPLAGDALRNFVIGLMML